MNFSLAFYVRMTVLLLTTLLLESGCMLVNAGDPGWVKPTSWRQRAGQVVILRGLIGIWSVGLDGLAKQVNDAGIQATVFQNDQWPFVAGSIARSYRGAQHPEPLVLIGHSYGADNVIRIARVLNQKNVAVDLLITFDPVTPPSVPPNVRMTLNYYESRGALDSLPLWRGIPLTQDPGSKGALLNFDLRTNRRDLRERDVSHGAIVKDKRIHGEILQWLLRMCPPRGGSRKVN